MAFSFRRASALGLIAASTLALAGCMTETTYRPATGNGFSREGYSERQVEANRFVVTFAGNTMTSRDTVEKYLLFRAAELTTQQGYDYFVMADRDTDKHRRSAYLGTLAVEQGQRSIHLVDDDIGETSIVARDRDPVRDPGRGWRQGGGVRFGRRRRLRLHGRCGRFCVRPGHRVTHERQNECNHRRGALDGRPASHRGDAGKFTVR